MTTQMGAAKYSAIIGPDISTRNKTQTFANEYNAKSNFLATETTHTRVGYAYVEVGNR